MARALQPATPAVKPRPPATEAKAAPQEQPSATRFECHAPAARAVFLAGTFNGWDPKATPMIKDVEGHWTVAVVLLTGRYEFKFVVDGAWCCEPGCEGPHHGCPKCVPNSSGTMNRLIEVT
ncbi:MAG: glycogen-binding domain-containing protein [Planctomycetaceae bacterium]|nr:glycogen-binding domain-containing protein [Planctomycetaceae bacterium]